MEGTYDSNNQKTADVSDDIQNVISSSSVTTGAGAPCVENTSFGVGIDHTIKSFSSVLGASAGYMEFQSATYVPSLQAFFLGFKHNDNSSQSLIVKCDSSFSPVQYFPLYAGHCNDMTYNPQTNRIYISTMTHTASIPNIIVMIPSPMAVDSDCYPLSNYYSNYEFSRISYSNNRFYLMSGGTL